MTSRTIWIAGLLLSLAGGLGAQKTETERLAPIQAEADLEKRSKYALEYARGAVSRVEAAYKDADSETARAVLASILEAVELSQESLDETGKSARKKPKHFKRAEIGVRKLLFDLQSLERSLTFDERKDLAPIIARLDEINSQLLERIMQKKR